MFTKTATKGMAAAALTLSVMLGGCAGQKSAGHQEAVNHHVERYNAMRSAMMLDMARQQFETGDLDMAEKTVREAAGVDPTNPRLHLMAGRIAMERGQLERAFHHFSLSIELNEELPDAWYYQGLVLQRWSRTQDACDRYRRAHELQPDSVSYLLAMTEMMIALSDIDGAIVTLEEKLAYFDQNASIRLALAHLYGMKQQPDRALRYFEQASMLEPDNLQMRENLALAQVSAGRHDAAIRTLEQLLIEPTLKDRRDLRRVLGDAYLKTKRTQRARQVYLELARSPQAQASDWIRLGEMALEDNDLYGALEAANQAVRLEPEQHSGYMLAGMVWQRRGRLDDSLRMFDRAAELSPADAAPLILRGLALERAGRTAAAIEAYTEALRRQPEDSRARRLLSNVQ